TVFVVIEGIKVNIPENPFGDVGFGCGRHFWYAFRVQKYEILLRFSFKMKERIKGLLLVSDLLVRT
ncbi:MAG: hypothetical protein Q7T20_09355, partial [Saprospiraceae bacterium]|nr:hypothetical protein [Saprospiraceae bacterium]